MIDRKLPSDPRMRTLPRLIFMTRWLQVPLYLGLIVAQCVYVWQFWVELVHLVEAAVGSEAALDVIRQSVSVPGADPAFAKAMSRETLTMLLVLGLIDVVMISNLLIMVIVGGYETFVSRMELNKHPDQPEWLSHVNASVLKITLAMAILGISSIHLLRTFLEAGNLGSPGAALTETGIMWQTIIHTVFILSAIGIALVDRMGTANLPAHRKAGQH
jgi:uncharacterized protein (TIGR00645 family)